MPGCGAGGPARNLVQIPFGAGVAMQNVMLGPFLDIEHKLHRHTGLVWPMRVGGLAAVTNQIPFHSDYPSSKVVTPKMRSWAILGSGPMYMRAQPKTSTICLSWTNCMAAGLFSGASKNSGPPWANGASPA